jgi:hypothetical protein
MLSQSMISPAYAVVYDTGNRVDVDEASFHILNGIPVVFAGNNSDGIYQIYSPRFIVENSKSVKQQVAIGIWIQGEENETIEHQIYVYDNAYTERVNESVQRWLQEKKTLSMPEGYCIQGLITQIDHHEPYGVLETFTEVLQLIEDNNEYDWYDVTVTQRLTPGINYTSSSWEWNWLQYTMNGSLGDSNIVLSDYDPPSLEELPSGPFGFLWNLLGFDLRKYFSWLFPPEPRVEGVDMSDFSIELFRVRHRVQRRYRYRNEPLEERHQYIIRIDEGKAPIFWHQTQVQYSQANNFAQIPHISQPLASGYIVKKR